ncbi:MAG: hypothetical protein ACREDY_06525 [Bradyrhizobium sp.]
MAIAEEEILSFVQSSIRSAWTLEVLLLLRRDSRQSWTIDDLVRELRGSVALVTESLNALDALGLVTTIAAGGYHYRAQTAQLDELVSALVLLYGQKPITVLRTIFASPNDKIQSFSDAFLIKKT